MTMPPSDRDAIREASRWFALLQDPDSGGNREQFEGWLRRDERNLRAFNRVSETFSMGKHLPRQEPASRVALTPQGLFRQGRTFSGLVAVTAAGLLLCVSAAVWWWQGRGGQVDGQWLPETARLVTRIGEIRSLRLADGSTVILDTDTELLEEFSAQRRDLELIRGRARFDVAHEPRPFVVHAGQSLVTAHGTLFDVRLDGARASVRLLRGAIDVALSGPVARGSRQKRLRPGDAVWSEATTGVTSLPSTGAPMASQAGWPDALLDFDHIDLRALAAEANRYSQTKLLLQSDAVGQLAVSGTFKVGDAARLADHLALLLDLDVQRRDNGDVVLSAKSQ